MRLNPYPRGSARPERYIYGRSEQIRAIERFTGEVQAARSSNVICFLAPAGLGKTSLLKLTRRRLQQQGWFCGYTEASSDAATAILELLADAEEAMPPEGMGKRFRDRLQELTVSAGPVGLGLKLGGAPSANVTIYSQLSRLLASLGVMAADAGTGVALIIDEAQVLPRQDMELIMRVVNRHDDLPIAVIIGGLPSIPERMITGSENDRTGPDIWYHPLYPLSPEESWHALELPAAHNGCSFGRDALESLVGYAEGHPLVLQMLGSAAWLAADRATRDGVLPTITGAHARQAIESVRAQLSISVYLPIWLNGTPSDRAVLRAAAAAARGMAGPDGRQLTWTLTASSMPAIPGMTAFEVMKSLHKYGGNGVIYQQRSPHDRDIRFVMPGFADYLVSANMT